MNATTLDVALNFDWSSKGSLLLINWTAPFTLDITYNNIDIHYYVEIVYNSENSLTSRINSTSKTSYISTLPDVNCSIARCISFYVTITAYNDAGRSNSTTVIENLLEEGMLHSYISSGLIRK